MRPPVSRARRAGAGAPASAAHMPAFSRARHAKLVKKVALEGKWALWWVRRLTAPSAGGPAVSASAPLVAAGLASARSSRARTEDRGRRRELGNCFH
jgi:hypothetical protein